MYQIPMRIWNEIAKSQPLSEPWATLFRMTPEQLPEGLKMLVDEPAEKLGADNRTVLAYTLVAPLLLENEAISEYIVVEDRLDLRAAMPELISVNEAVILASMEYRLNPSQQAKLQQLLEIALKTQEEIANRHQQKEFIPLLVKQFDDAFRLRYYSFKDAAKFALDNIHSTEGEDAADLITLEHLQGAYIAMSSGRSGVDNIHVVGSVAAKNEIERHIATQRMLPEQEQKLMPILVRLIDAAFRLGYHSFKDASKFVLDKIREVVGVDLADAIKLSHLQGAYIGMSGSNPGADAFDVVGKVKSKSEIERHTVTPQETSMY